MTGNLSAAELCEAARISPRQLGHWVSTGFVKVAVPSPGTGNWREFSVTEAARVIAVAALVHAGFRVDAAAKMVDP